MHFPRVSRGSSRKTTPRAPQRNASITRSRSRESRSMTARVRCFNFLDGADGLCAGVTAVIAGAYLVVPGITLSVLGTIVAWSLLGVSIGFLVFNFPPRASIFLGDSGSTLFGFGVAFLALDFCSANAMTEHHIALVVPLLMAALPLLDGIMAVLRRLHGGKSLL